MNYTIRGINASKIASPFVKWAGGKRGIIKTLLSKIPLQFTDYYEPFLGGGALFFELHSMVRKAYISDINKELMLTYQAIKEQPQGLIDKLHEYSIGHSTTHYYEVRATQTLKKPIEIAARFIYSNSVIKVA